MYQRARRGISYLPQEASVFRKLSVADNLLAILETVEPDKNIRQLRMERLLEEFGITSIAASQGYALSGGERRRVEIARALITGPLFVLLDEPFAGIDPIAVADIQSLIVSLKNRNIGVLISDHNVRETLGVCDAAYIMSSGQVIEYGTPDEIANSKKAREIYLGDDFRL
jgi:lipopolysaccharide export system ATP-binding protein